MHESVSGFSTKHNNFEIIPVAPCVLIWFSPSCTAKYHPLSGHAHVYPSPADGRQGCPGYWLLQIKLL